MSPPAEVAKGTANNAWLDLLQRHGPKRIASHAAVAYAGWQMAGPLAKRLRQWDGERRTYTITVPGTDAVYDDLHEWVLGLIPDAERRALVASTGEWQGDFVTGVLVSSDSPGLKYGVTEAPKREVRHVRLRYDSRRVHKVKLAGHTVLVGLERDELGGGKFDDLPSNWRRRLERVVLTVTSPGARDAVVEHIEQLSAKNHAGEDPRPPLYIADRWGSGWDRRDDLPRRSLESVILPDGHLDRLVKDLGDFLGDEAEYNRRTIPWHRGYLFSGPPGTGKTSVVKALCEHFRLPLYYLPLGDLKDDTELVSLVSRVSPRSVLLLEDIDVYHAATERTDTSKGVTLSALLNALDGIWTPHGLIVFMTTNRREALDDAVVRPGRVDYEAELGLLTEEQAEAMVRWFYAGGKPLWSTVPSSWVGHSPAELLQHLTEESKRDRLALMT